MSIKKTKLVIILYLVAVVGLLTFSAITLFSDISATSASNTEIATLNSQNEIKSPASGNGENGFHIFSEILNSSAIYTNTTFSNTGLEIFSRLFFAVLLSTMLAFRPKRDLPLFQRNFHVIQTQILLAVVAASLMMIVGNNAARAFAIFAAVSLVRFRTNIKNPKEITILLVSLAIGLAAGVGYWQLGMILTFFVVGLLWFLEYKEDEKTFRSMELTVKTEDVNKSQHTLKDTFEKYALESELRRIDLPKEEKSIGKITYFLNIPLGLRTDSLTEQILFSDSENIQDIQWSHKRKALQIYE